MISSLVDRADRIWDALTRLYEDHPVGFLTALVAIGFFLRVAATPFGTPVNLDVFAYMLKAIEIGRGDWTPVRSHAIGWPILLAPVLAPFAHLSMMTWMNLTRLTADFVGALVVVPLAILVRETL